MRKALTAAAVAVSSLVVPMLGSGAAYADGVAPTPALSGCTTVFLNDVLVVADDRVVTINGLVVTIDGGLVVDYAVSDEGFTIGYVNCLV